jgi:hypothetical protein
VVIDPLVMTALALLMLASARRAPRRAPAPRSAGVVDQVA